MRQPSPVKNLTPGQAAYVLASLFVSGAATLILEIVGTRVISPYYGTSLYCWSALITVTLIALAAGYALGGRWADRSPYLTLFARLLCLAGLAVAVVPGLRMLVLRETTPLGIQWGALTSSVILIGPSLVALAALGPLAIRLRAEMMATVGRSAGDIYAVSTLGSVAGAALAGFVLIPLLPLSKLLLGLAAVLLLLGSIGFYLSRQKLALPRLAAAAAAAAAMFGFWPRATVETNLVTIESAYGQIKILDFADKRYLLVNGTTQSMAPLGGDETLSQYSKALEWAALSSRRPRRALVIGAGAGLLTTALERHYGLVADSVEVDPAILDAAKKYFGFKPRGDAYVEDGRTYLERTGRRYDAVFLDAFGSELPPYHLFTQEAFESMKRALEPGGVLAINLMTAVEGPDAAPWRSAYRTLQSVFPETRAYVASDVVAGLGNVVFFCSDRPLDSSALKRARPEIKETLSFMLAHELKSDETGDLMTDDHAPMEYLLADSAVRWRTWTQGKVQSVLLY